MPKKGPKKKSKKSVRRRSWNPEEYASKMAPIVARMVGLDILGLSDEQMEALLKDILIQIIGDRVTKPKPETLVNAIRRGQDKIYSIIASRLLDSMDPSSITPDQFEFILSYIGPFVIEYIDKLIDISKRLDPSRIDEIRHLWELAWSQRNGGPIGTCPRCGFKAVGPDGTCIVCGYVLSDKELKNSVDFEVKLNSFIQEASCEDLKRILNNPILYVNDYSVTITRTSPWDVEIHLNKDELEKVRTEYVKRCEKRRRETLAIQKSEDEIIKEIISKL
ncbi:hypothetical protein EYM_03490 [Ignicoccus islandicus DSM 13165]|uniref:Uncharacterized protein n=1 Tax=Ignicoccus islandicus DSM 13165 TaxID=940295 RepID=A0A0U3FSF1_9CREN|nr:hypothetical protein [Ignicoccus islandicus]ALU12416.1 hypothetical protein EYM_03490 [Ignicoccus islandicus DSM 13165]